MNEVIQMLTRQIEECGLTFTKKPILIGGMAKEYHGIRKSGADIDLVVCEEDYQTLAKKYPNNRKDIYGDLGVVLGPFEIWRCIMLLDYDFYIKGAIDDGIAYIASLDKLLLMCTFAMHVDKYMDDLKLIKDHYHQKFMNPSYYKYMLDHDASYQKSRIIYGGKYIEE